MRKKMIGIAMAVVAILVSAVFYGFYQDTKVLSKTTSKPKDPLIMAFKATDADFSEIKIKGWVLVNNNFTKIEDLNNLITKIDDATTIPLQEFKKETIQAENFKGITITGRQQGFDLQLLVQTVKGIKGTGILPETYVIITADTDTLHYGYNNLKDEIYKGLKSIAAKPQISTVVSGKIRKELNPRKREEQIDEVFNSLQAKKIDLINIDNLTSSNGYTPVINDIALVGSEKVNLSAALRYNFLEKATYVYIGSPLISTEY